MEEKIAKYKCNIEQEVQVKFKDPEKAKEVYLGDDWKSVFFDFDDLDAVAEHLAYVVDENSGHWNRETKRTEQFIEGFGAFEWKGGGKFELVDLAAIAGGGIVITIESREITDTTKIKESA